jgi:hypothetical protein
MAGLNENELLQALRAATREEYDILGYMGKREDGVFVYLSRELATQKLVALKLESEGMDENGEPTFSIELARDLDATIPDVDALCPRCRSKLRRWARYCTQCGLDVTGISASSGATHTRESLLDAVRSVAGSDYEVLGEMSRAEGGGLVYFAREQASDKIVALQLNREGQEDYSLHVTRVLKPVPRRSSTDDSPSRISLVHRHSAQDRELVREWSDKLQRESAERRAHRRVDDQPVERRAKPSQPALQFDTKMKIALAVIGVLVLALVISLLG